MIATEFRRSHEERRNSYRSPRSHNQTRTSRPRSLSIVRTRTNQLSVGNAPAKVRNCTRYKTSFERRTERLKMLNKEIDDLYRAISDKKEAIFELVKAINKRDTQYKKCMLEQQQQQQQQQQQLRGGMRSRRRKL